jgi:hypothetical protein
MKRGLLVITIMLVGQCAAFAQSSGFLTLAKEVNGTIARGALSFTLKSDPNCDQTQIQIPDGSRLVSDSFALNTDENGAGAFYGAAAIISPDGRALHIGIMRGTVGVGQGCNQGASCLTPGRLQGIFEPVPTFAPNPNGEITMANFSAELVDQSTGPAPVYRGQLAGLFASPPSFAQRVRIAPDKFSYLSKELIVATITNGSEKSIQAYDLKSFCTIVELQREVNGRWVNTGECLLARVPQPVNIGPGESLKVELQPNSETPGLNVPGVYRLALTFRAIEDDQPASDYLVAVSPLFRIASMPKRDGVSVFADQSVYDVGQNIKVTVANNTEYDLLTSGGRTDCTIVYLQKLSGRNWVNVAECPLLIITRMIKITSRQKVTFQLPDESLTKSLEPGVYRLEFGYFVVDNGGQTIRPESKVYSAQLHILPRQ